MISDRGMTSLRVAATLAHVLPGLGARIRHGDRVILEVDSGGLHGASAHPASSPAAEPFTSAVRRIAPGGFRCAVAHAHRRRIEGEQLRFLDLEPGCDPVVDIRVPRGGTGRAGGIFCVPVAGRWLWGMAAEIDATTAYRLGAELVEESLPQPGVHALGIRPDVATDVSLLYAETCAGPGTSSDAWVQELFESLLARWTVADLVDRLTERVDLNQGLS